MFEKLKKAPHEGLLFIFIVSLVAMCGSLYFSEIKDYTPCKLCWYQRILMYPLVIISLVTYIKKSTINYTLISIMSGMGFLLGVYHYCLQKIPKLSEVANACGLVPCNGQYTNYFGFITIPFMSLTAFLIIFIISLVCIKISKSK